MPKVTCRHCHHPEEVHNVNGTGECLARRSGSAEAAACGCVKLVPIDWAARARRKGTFLVVVRMFVKNRWIESGEMRIRSGGAANAAALGIRQARRECLPPRKRVEQFGVTIRRT